MTTIANATPVVLFFNLIAKDLEERGFNVRITSLYQEQPTTSPWTLGLRVHPRKRDIQGHFLFDLDVNPPRALDAMIETDFVEFETLTHQPVELPDGAASAAATQLHEAIEVVAYSTCGWPRAASYREVANAIESAMATADLMPVRQDEPVNEEEE